MTAMPHETVRARYAVTLGTQIFRLLVQLVSATIVPRALGPAVYGIYSFLLSTSTALRGFVDNATQQAFFTFSAQQHESGSLTRLYAAALALQFALVMGFIAVAAILGRTEWLWHTDNVGQIFWITLLDWALFLALSLQQLGDSKGRTVRAQIIGAGVSIPVLVALLGLWATHSLTLATFVAVNMCGALVTSGCLAYWLLVANRRVFWDGTLAAGDYVRRWWQFGRPLILLQYYSPIVTFLGVYLIQRWYGSSEQAYYALALQWCAFAMIFTNAAMSIFWREMAHHSAHIDRTRMARAYQQFSGVFFFLVLVLSCWLSMSSGFLVRFVAGERFAAAGSVLAIMAFYPLAQTTGQLATACFKATERTGSFARLSVLLSIPDLALTYLLIAPESASVPGFGIGAVGMAIKTALYGLVSVQVYHWFNCRHLGISYAAVLGREIAGTAAVGATALLVLGPGQTWLRSLGVDELLSLVLASAGYGLIIAALIWLRPALLGATREQLRELARMLVRSRILNINGGST